MGHKARKVLAMILTAVGGLPVLVSAIIAAGFIPTPDIGKGFWGKLYSNVTNDWRNRDWLDFFLGLFVAGVVLWIFEWYHHNNNDDEPNETTKKQKEVSELVEIHKASLNALTGSQDSALKSTTNFAQTNVENANITVAEERAKKDQLLYDIAKFEGRIQSILEKFDIKLKNGEGLEGIATDLKDAFSQLEESNLELQKYFHEAVRLYQSRLYAMYIIADLNSKFSEPVNLNQHIEKILKSDYKKLPPDLVNLTFTVVEASSKPKKNAGIALMLYNEEMKMIGADYFEAKLDASTMKKIIKESEKTPPSTKISNSAK